MVLSKNQEPKTAMSNFLAQSWLIDRRHALRALGSCISLPFLECMVPLRAAEQSSATPRRSAFIYLANGVHSLNYQITTPGEDYQFSRSLKPLEKHREVITPISGLHHPGALSHHHNCISVWLTGGKLGPSDRNTISVDQKMAEVTAKHTRYPSLEVALTARFPRLDGGRRAVARDAPLRARSSRRCSQNRKGARRPSGGPCAAKRASWTPTSQKCADSNRRWARRTKDASINTLPPSARRKSARGGPMRGSIRRSPPSPTPIAKRTNRDVAATMAGDYFRTVYDLIVLAFQTDVTRVATFSLGGEGDAFSIPEIGITESRHQLSHHGGDPGYMEKLTLYDTFAIEQFSYFLTRLAETKDLNGKPLLGSTMALFGSGMSYGHSHGNANLPLVLAGGSDLGLKHGSHLDFNHGPLPGLPARQT